jgi:large subunit ribosomal protein L17
MRHLKRGRKLGRNSTHRLALMRNLAAALFEHGRIVTTVAKAKELRPFAEKLITLAKRGSLHARRLVLARLGNNKAATRRLFAEIAPKFTDRPGGYTRILKRAKVRLGDAGPTAFIELVDEPVTRREATAPAPVVTAPAPAEGQPAAT